MSFLYQEPTPVGELANQLAVNAFHYKPEDTLYGDYRMDGLNHSYAAKTLQQMTAENARITLIAPDVRTTHVAPIYHTEYSLNPISKNSFSYFYQHLMTSTVSYLSRTVFSTPDLNLYLWSLVVLCQHD